MIQNGISISRSVYFNKCTDILSNKEIFEKYRTTPSENLYFENGPWLKQSIKNALHAIIDAKIINRGFDGKYSFAEVLIKNISKDPAYPVTLDVSDDKKTFLNENFFMLKPNEEKKVCITCDIGDVGRIRISFWNGDTVFVE